MNDNQEPDALEKGIRFGFGFVFGAVFAFFVIVREIAEFTGAFWAGLAAVAVVSGLAAMRYGDEFWHELSDWFRNRWWW